MCVHTEKSFIWVICAVFLILSNSLITLLISALANRYHESYWWLLFHRSIFLSLFHRHSPCPVRRPSNPYKDSKPPNNRLSVAVRAQQRHSLRGANGDRGKPSKGKEKKESKEAKEAASKAKDEKVNNMVRILHNFYSGTTICIVDWTVYTCCLFTYSHAEPVIPVFCLGETRPHVWHSGTRG